MFTINHDATVIGISFVELIKELVVPVVHLGKVERWLISFFLFHFNLGPDF